MTKTHAIIALFIVFTSFAAGRYTTPERVVIQKEIVEVEKKSTEVERNKKKETEVTERTNPDGSKETITKTKEETTTEKKTETDKSKTDSATEERSRSKVNVSILAGLPISTPVSPVYGAAMTSELVGPISAGIWFLSPGIAGISVGVSF